MFLLVHSPSLLSVLPSILRLQISPIYSLLIPQIYVFSSKFSPNFQTKISIYPLKNTSNWTCPKPNSLLSLKIASLCLLLQLTLPTHRFSQVRASHEFSRLYFETSWNCMTFPSLSHSHSSSFPLIWISTLVSCLPRLSASTLSSLSILPPHFRQRESIIPNYCLQNLQWLPIPTE